MKGFRKSILVLLGLASGLVSASVLAGEAAEWPFPQERKFGEYRAVIHAPQIRSWPNFKTFTGRVAIEFFPGGDARSLLATADISGETRLEYDKRLVVATGTSVDKVVFASGGKPAYVDAITNAVYRQELAMPLDSFLAALSDSVLEGEVPADFNTDPPPIFVASEPSILLFVNGAPYWNAVAGGNLELLENANWPIVRVPDSTGVYLLERELWLRADTLAGPWQPTREVPAALGKLPQEEQYAQLAAAYPAPATGQTGPQVIYVKQPTELIVTSGHEELAAIAGVDALEYVSNADSPLFRYGELWYFLAAGRWFQSAELHPGDWSFVKELPAVFAQIPGDSPRAEVLASVPGTVEARMAALEAMLPRERSAAVGDTAAVTVSYDGSPQFQPIPQVAVYRAVNTPYQVLRVDNRYYLCHEAIWYDSDDPNGPWVVTADVPEEIYEIPAQSPAYPVSAVSVASSSSSSVTYVATPAYSTSVYVVNGVPWYGTGWYYPPYLGAVYYPYYTSYGHGSVYNPNTGTYASRSVAYGPYGGYSYNEAYNPTTGRSGYMETSWNGDTWKSYSQAYGARTGTTATTNRKYSEDNNKMTMDRTLERDGNEMTTERTTNYDKGTSSTTRNTSGGGSSQQQRNWDDDGNFSSSGSIQGADGRSATIEGSYKDGEGSTTITGSQGGSGTITRSTNGDGATREGSFTNSEGETINTSTQRDGNRTVSQAEGPGGGSMTSVSEGRGRTTMGESGSGDLYAGHDGNVYKNTGDGWQRYDGSSGQWSEPTQPQREATRNSSTRSLGNAIESPGGARSSGSGSEYSQLSRDAASRQQGRAGFQRRQSAGGVNRGGFNRGGLRRRR